MDNASDYGSEDSRSESWQARIISFFSDRFTFYQTLPIVDFGITLFFHVYCHQNNVVTKMIVSLLVYSQIFIFSQHFSLR